jgi:hypothetical protein
MKITGARWGMLSLVVALASQAGAPVAQACGGFFCSSTPVDQNAERIVFKVRDDGKTDMIVQISYQGKAEDFAWLLPLAEPPAKEDLGIFPQLALSSLDAQTGVSIQRPCVSRDSRGGGELDDLDAAAEEEHGVQVFVRAQVGNYDVAVIGSSDAQASADWLDQNGFRISPAMLGFLKLYTDEGMKFLALKLLPEKSVNDITPFKLTLPGTTPSIPLRLSAVAAEPEMGIVAWIFGKERYEPANAPELSISDSDLRYDFSTGRSNWTAVVARAVDEMNGRGFVVENAQSLDELRQFAMNSFANTEEQMKAQTALLELFAGASYMTRLYTRVSPEEMTYDPSFRRSNKGDVSRFRTAKGDADECRGDDTPDPCDYVACGALGLCRTVVQDGQQVAACACAEGATARTTFEASTNQSAALLTTVSCVDQRLSFLNPGDRNAAGEALSDPCVGVDCGGHGKCVAMNMTPTCACEHGYVAQGKVAADGTRSAVCLKPKLAVPDAFYNRRQLERDTTLPVGREMQPPTPSGPSDYDDPVPDGNPMNQGRPKPGANHKASCAVRPASDGPSAWAALLSAALGGVFLARRRGRGRAD